MQSSIQGCDPSQITLGQRRGKYDLARFSLDLTWARGVSEVGRVGPYPSPPMSGSPSFPPNKNPNPTDRVQGGFGTPSQDVSTGLATPQTDLRRDSRTLAQYPQIVSQPSTLPSQPQGQVQPSQYQRFGEASQSQTQYQYLPQQQQQTSEAPPSTAPMPSTATYSQYETRESFPISQSSDLPRPLSPRAQRKPKGHVAAACVPCKRAHLRCDNSRPCARCLSNGKEDTCVDTQHKKRGRPRLRDERETRYEGMGGGYSTPMDAGVRRPLSMAAYPPSSDNSGYDPSLSRPGSYRVLKSQGGPPPSRYFESASAIAPNVYGGEGNFAGRLQTQREIPCAYLTTDLQIVRTTRMFDEVLGISQLAGRQLLDIVATNDRDRVQRLRQHLDAERQNREPQYLPPIYGRVEQERTIHAIGMSPEEIESYRADRVEFFTFQSPDSQRGFQVKFGLQKFQSTYFVVLIIHIPSTPQTGMQHPQSSPYTRESHTQYGYQGPQPGFGAPAATVSPYGQFQGPPYGSRESSAPNSYRPSSSQTQMSTGSSPISVATSQQGSSTIPSYGQTFQPQGYPAQALREIPRSQLPLGQSQPPARQSELQLPPIRTATSSGQPMPREERRLDIGGLLQDPSAHRDRMR